MGIKFKNMMKKIMAEAVITGLLLVPAVLSPAGYGEGSLQEETLVGNEQPGTGNGDEGGIMPCGDLEDEGITHTNNLE